ncbi:MAG: hypothetical protein NWE89_00845 [Candidatus Bathyarchaeota archaeon]|nr:hypothetical protein [Candidatus Bathyarchaeota archaeon]
MNEPITREEQIRAFKNAQELEFDRVFLEETMKKHQARMRAISQSIMEEKSAIHQERPSGTNWRKIIMSVVLSNDPSPVAYR